MGQTALSVMSVLMPLNTALSVMKWGQDAKSVKMDSTLTNLGNAPEKFAERVMRMEFVSVVTREKEFNT